MRRTVECDGERNDGGNDRSAASRAAKPWYKVLYVQVLIAIVLGVIVGCCGPDLRHQRLDQGARRRLYQADQDGDRADHLLHGGVGHFAYSGCQEGRPRRRQGAGLFRGRLDLRADHRADRSAIWSRPGRGLRRYDGRCRRRWPTTPSRRKRRSRSISSCNIIPDTVVGAFATRRDPAGAAVLDPVRLLR